MASKLPARPNLDQLRHQAKDLMKAHERRDPGVCARLRVVARFAKSTDDEILAAELTLSDAQFALALEYGFAGWREMKKHVESAGEGPAFTDLADLERVGNRGIQLLLRDLDFKEVALAMTKMPAPVYEKIWKSLSRIARDELKEEWKLYGPAGKMAAAVEGAQRRVLEVANRLAAELEQATEGEGKMAATEWETALVREMERKPAEHRTAAELVPVFVELSKVVRREGLVAVENFATNHVGDELLKIGLREVIGGADMDVVKGLLEARKATLIQAHERRLSMIIAAVEGIGTGLNPRLMEEKCRAYLT